MRIVLDTNVLFDDPVMVRAASRRALDLLAPARATLVFCPVVLGELNRQRHDSIEDLHGPIRSRVKKLGALSGVDPATALSQMQAMVDAADDRWTSRWNEILSDENVEVGPWPDTDSQQMTERELDRRRPFMDKEPGTIGHRDTLIWLGLIEMARDEPHDEIIFVTADKGFLAGNDLHPHLLEDLDAVGARHSFTRLGTIHALVTELQRETESTGWEAWRESRIAELLYEEIQQLEASDFAEHWDEREGGNAAPTFDVGLPYTGHDWDLVHVDGPQDLKIEDAEFGTDVLTCTFLLDISLSGFMDKFEWYGDDHPAVDLWDADWNDHVVLVETGMRVRLRARFEIDDREETAYFDEFLDTEVVPAQGTITLT